MRLLLFHLIDLSQKVEEFFRQGFANDVFEQSAKLATDGALPGANRAEFLALSLPLL